MSNVKKCSNEYCSAYMRGLCPYSHLEFPFKKQGLANYAFYMTKCNGCKSLIASKHSIAINGSFNYEFCFRCALQYCSNERRMVYVNENVYPSISVNTLEKIRLKLNEYDPSELERISQYI